MANDPSNLSPYNANPELSAMKEDIAQRRHNLMLQTMLIVGGLAVLGAMTGGLLLPIGSPLMGAMVGSSLGMMAGTSIASLTTLKEQTRLKLDEEMAQSYMGGKGNWGHGFRQEVLEKGYSVLGPVPPQFAGRENDRGAGKGGRGV